MAFTQCAKYDWLIQMQAFKWVKSLKQNILEQNICPCTPSKYEYIFPFKNFEPICKALYLTSMADSQK
jgi:hypothetical protein